MVWPNTNSCRPNPGGESQESAEFQRQMEELRQRERAALQRQVSQFFIIIFLFKKRFAKNNNLKYYYSNLRGRNSRKWRWTDVTNVIVILARRMVVTMLTKTDFGKTFIYNFC